MSFELNQNELQSYEEKYNKILKAKITLTFAKTKKIIIDQFSITDAQANIILKKVFANQKSDELNREGFFTTLRYIQCLQNGVKIEECNINTIKLSFPLKVNNKKKLKNSFQTNVVDDPLGKSMLALNELQSLIKTDSQQEEQRNQQVTKSKINKNKLNTISEEAQQKQNQIQNTQEEIQQPTVLKEEKIEEKNQQIQQKQQMIDIDIDDEFTQAIQQTQKQENTTIVEFHNSQQNIENVQTDNTLNTIQIIQQQLVAQEQIDQTNLTFQNSNLSQQDQSQIDQSKQQQKPIKKIEKFGDISFGDSVQENVIQQQQIQLPDVIELSDDDFDSEKQDKTKEIYVWISGYQFEKEGSLSNYYSFTVCSEILTDPDNRIYTKYVVIRRYTDFKMLQQYFTDTKQGEIIPSLPEKEGVFGNIMSKVREDTKMLDERKEQLQLFLKDLIRYKEDKVLMSFLTINKKFNEILIELRYQSESSEDSFLPNPDDFTITEKIKKLVFSDYQSLVLDYFKGNQEIEAKFQEEYRQVQQHYKNLENKKNELLKFKQQLIQFYEPVDRFVFNQQINPTLIVTEQNLAYAQQTIKIYQQQKILQQNETMSQVKQIQFQLDSLTYSYQQIQKQIFKWFQNKQKLKNDKQQNLKQLQQSESEEGRLKFVLDKTNDTLIKLVRQITQDLNNLLETFVNELTYD